MLHGNINCPLAIALWVVLFHVEFIILVYWGWDKKADISQTIYSNALSWMKIYLYILIDISLNFVPNSQINSIPVLVGTKSLSEPMMVCLLMPICTTPHQYVKSKTNLPIFLAAAGSSMNGSASPSVSPFVHLSHLFHYVPIIVSSWNFQLLPMTEVRSMQKVKIRGQRSWSQRSKPHLKICGP